MSNTLDVRFTYFLHTHKFFIRILMFYIIIFITELVICCSVKFCNFTRINLFKEEFCEMKFHEVQTKLGMTLRYQSRSYKTSNEINNSKEIDQPMITIRCRYPILIDVFDLVE